MVERAAPSQSISGWDAECIPFSDVEDGVSEELPLGFGATDGGYFISGRLSAGLRLGATVRCTGSSLLSHINRELLF